LPYKNKHCNLQLQVFAFADEFLIVKTMVSFYCYPFIMKAIVILIAGYLSIYSINQHQTSLPHGTVYGTKPNTGAMLKAAEVETFMGKKTRVSL